MYGMLGMGLWGGGGGCRTLNLRFRIDNLDM